MEWEHCHDMRQGLCDFLTKLARTLTQLAKDAPTRVFWSLDMATIVAITEQMPDLPIFIGAYTTCGKPRNVPSKYSFAGMRIMDCDVTTYFCPLPLLCPVCGQTYAGDARTVFPALCESLRLWADHSKSMPEVTYLHPGEAVSIRVEEKNEMVLVFSDLAMASVTPLVRPFHTILDDMPAHTKRNMDMFHLDSLPFGYDGILARSDQRPGTPMQIWLKGPDEHHLVLFRPSDATGDGVIHALFAQSPRFKLQHMPVDDALDSLLPVSDLSHIPETLLANRPEEPLHIRPDANGYYEFAHRERGHLVHATVVHADSEHKRLIVRIYVGPSTVTDYTLRLLGMPNAERTTLPVLAYDTVEEGKEIENEMDTVRADVNVICQGWYSNVSLDQLRACLQPGGHQEEELIIPGDLTLEDLTLEGNPF